MRTALVLAVLAGGGLAAGCSSPTLSIELDYAPDGAVAPGGIDLAAFVHGEASATITIRAVAADRLGVEPPPGQPSWPRDPSRHPGDPASCDEVELARVPADTLAGATVSQAADGTLADVPRLGHKLIVAEVLGPGGQRQALGCAPVDDIEHDTHVTVPMAPASHAIQLTRLSAVAAGGGGPDLADKVYLLAAAVPPDASGNDAQLGGLDVQVDRYDRRGLVDSTMTTTEAGGGKMIAGLLDGAMPGPVEALIRLRDAVEPLRIGLWNAWARVPIDGHDSLRLDAAPGTRPSGAAGLVLLPGDDTPHWIVAASYVDAADGPELIAVGPKAGVLQTRRLRGVTGAPVVWMQHLYVVTSDGWHQVEPAGTDTLVLGPRIASDPQAGSAASEVVAVKPCPDSTPLMLVRRAAGTDYVAYTAPGQPARGGNLSFDRLENAIGDRSVIDGMCVDGDGGTAQPILVLESTAGELQAIGYLGDGPGADTLNPLSLPGIAALADYTGSQQGARGLVGFVADSGPRVRSFRFTSAFETDHVVMPTDAIDAPLASPPVALAATDLDYDGSPDVVSLLPAAGGVRLQVVYTQFVDGEPMTATSPTIDLGRDATDRPRLRVVDVDDDGKDDIVVLGDTSLDIFAPRP
ncbi:MAG TPA: hypothetical protein VHE35_32400 [Kofleriaceae bacterium]|nr:hypothetical protein [Kofleriaceae bacterium]